MRSWKSTWLVLYIISQKSELLDCWTAGLLDC
jgi:hypothetical protein